MINLTPAQAVAYIKKICPFKYTDLPAAEGQALMDRIKREKLEPVDSGHSFHCWNDDYIIDGITYQVIGMLGSQEPPTVMLVEPNC
jgi:hypothetical protein